MQIKTIALPLTKTAEFDQTVNAATVEGWHLTRREVLPGSQYTVDNLTRQVLVLYAELVKPDELDEPQPFDPIEALHAIKGACLATSVEDCGERCPLRSWCEQLRLGGDPTDWVLPGEGLEP